MADLLVHFHGDPQTYWNNAKYANLNTIIVTVNYSGLSSAYSTPFSNAALFQTVLDEALAKVRLAVRHSRHACSGTSSAYRRSAPATARSAKFSRAPRYRNDIDALLAADSLYATTAGDGTPLDSQMVDYKTFAGLAKNGTKTFLFSHSQVPTYTYETTEEMRRRADAVPRHLGHAPTTSTASAR